MTLKLFLSCLPPLVPCITLQAKGPYEVMGGGGGGGVSMILLSSEYTCNLRVHAICIDVFIAAIPCMVNG